jgi:GNAT superfamily N-acetyltransferase
MLHDWYREVDLEVSWETFHQFPRHPDFRYEYIQGQMRISARPRTVHCVLDLEAFAASSPSENSRRRWSIRPLHPNDWPNLQAPFAAALGMSAPLCQLDREVQLRAAEDLLDATRSGADGPFVPEASFVLSEQPSGTRNSATDADDPKRIIGGILVTLIPSRDVRDFDPEQWDEPVPDAPFRLGWGEPHLTWIFVSPTRWRRGGGASLLRETVGQLRAAGYRSLTSTLLPGNVASLLWHWQMGFALHSHPASPGRIGA